MLVNVHNKYGKKNSVLWIETFVKNKTSYDL